MKYDPAAVLSVVHCHCGDCRRRTGAAFATWVAIRDTGWRWQGDAPGCWRSSRTVAWGVCGACGTPMSYVSKANGPVTNFLIGLFAAPGKLVPEAHYHWSERLPWIRLSDGLPRHSGDKASARVEQDLAAE